jgi:16S rRNA processing protein RimM
LGEPDDLVDVATIAGAYGVRGWARIRPFGRGEALQSAQTWWLRSKSAPEASLPLSVEACRRHSSAYVAKWHGYDSPEPIEALRGATIAISRAAFPPAEAGATYWVDLLGARVVNRAGVELGVVTGLQNNGAQDLLEVRREGEEKDKGAPLLIPLVAPYLDEIDAAGRCIRVDWEPDWL